VSDEYYYQAGTPILINSFKYFHPDIPLVVFRQDTIDKVFAEKGINFYNAKPTFAKLLTDKYDLIANIDCDHIITARLDAILEGDYDVACPINLNDFENTSVENVTEEMFLQGGLVASTNKKFWDVWEERNKEAMSYKCKENDIMNLTIYNTMPELKLKILDKDYGYYGCKSLNRESEFYLEGKKVMCRGEQVFAYHHAKGGIEKLNFDQMPFSYEVKQYFKYLGHYGRSITIK
jgi:hypothetical protein